MCRIFFFAVIFSYKHAFVHKHLALDFVIDPNSFMGWFGGSIAVNALPFSITIALRSSSCWSLTFGGLFCCGSRSRSGLFGGGLLLQCLNGSHLLLDACLGTLKLLEPLLACLSTSLIFLDFLLGLLVGLLSLLLAFVALCLHRVSLVLMSL